jgi:hypothetical protein
MKPVDHYFEKMLRRAFEAGDKSVLLNTIYQCLESGRPVPEWARLAFLDAWEAALRYEIKSWDQVFDRPVPRGTHLKTKRRNEALLPEIVRRVEARVAEKKPIDKGFFEKVARDLKIKGIKGGTTISNIYYDPRNWFIDPGTGRWIIIPSKNF